MRSILSRALVNSRFGRVLQGIRENETRMEAAGYPVYRFKLIAFVLAGALAGLGGALLANQNGLASPNMLHWTQSGMLLIMVILGGVGFLYGGVLGAAVLLLLEEVLSSYTIHWQLGVGLVLLAVVLYAPNGSVHAVAAKARPWLSISSSSMAWSSASAAWRPPMASISPCGRARSMR